MSSTTTGGGRQATSLPQAPATYTAQGEGQFRLAVEQAMQDVSSRLAALHEIVSGLGGGAHVHDTADITTGTFVSARLSGAYSGITGLGTLTTLTVSGAVEASGTTKMVGPVTIGAIEAADEHAILDLNHTTEKGFLPPKLTTTQRDNIVTPTVGLVIYNTSNSRLECYNGSSWENVATHTHAATDITSGTLSGDRISGSYTGITAVGQLSSLEVGGTLKATGPVTVGAIAAADASAILDLAQTTTKGLLPPKLTTTQRDAIGSPATGLLIFNTSTGQFEYYSGAAWAAVGGGGSAELLTSCIYAPGADTYVSTLSTSAADINAGSLVVTFTAPASGSVLVRLTGCARIETAGVNEAYYRWCLRSGSNVVADSTARVHYADPGGGWTGTSILAAGVSYVRKFTGLSGSYTWKWAHIGYSASYASGFMYGPNYGAGAMEVWAL